VSQLDIIPGFPDALAVAPPKAREYAALTLDEAIARSHALLDEAAERYEPEKFLLLFSGGSDSSLLAHLVKDRMDCAVHILTSIGIPQTAQYVTAVCAEWTLPVVSAVPPHTYEQLVLGEVRTVKNGQIAWRGFPGSGAHDVMYQRLKERALDTVRRNLVGPRGRAGQIAFVAGTRWSESDRRHRNASELDEDGAVIWVSPIVHWTEGHMREYRERFQCQEHHEHARHMLCHPGALPKSEVSINLHMSGDCLCGAYAKPGELSAIELFYPEVAAKIRALEDQVEATDIPWCRWGAGKDGAGPKDAPASAPGRLCARCAPEVVGQIDLFDHWVEQGLLTAAQATDLRGGTG
jgi:3'-phosphoadenosine 5'-phosphosulfate sulfotransferase (PAPS reductase)/FAD synthetase